MMEFNDQVTFVDYPGELERRELEVLIKLVPFVERDVEERCAELDDAQAMADGIYLKDGEKADELKKEFLEDCERKKKREWERVERLRRAILERAVRAFPELKAADAADGRWTMDDGRWTMDDGRCESSAPSAREEGKDFRSVSGGDAGGGPLSARVESASEFHDAAGGGTPQPGGSFSAMK